MGRMEDFIIINNELQCYVGVDTNVVVPDGVTSIAGGAFYRMEASTPCEIETVYLPETVVRIGTSAFRDCKNLRKVEIPNSVNYIGARAFYGCCKLSEIKLPDALTNIEEETFSGCTLLDVEIPANIIKIGIAAFKDTGLTRLTLHRGLFIIDPRAFENCKFETVEVLGDTLLPYGAQSFVNSQNFTKFVVSEDHLLYKEIDGCLYTKDGKTLVCVPAGKKILKIPYGVEIIGRFACYGEFRSGVEGVIFSETVKLIEEYAFAYCSLMKRLTIPGNIKVIKKYAFSKCQLEEVEIQEGVEVLETNAIEGDELEIFVVPKSMKRIDKHAVIKNGFGTLYVDLTRISKTVEIAEWAFKGWTDFPHYYVPRALAYKIGEYHVSFSDDEYVMTNFPWGILTEKHREQKISNFMWNTREGNWRFDKKSERYLSEHHEELMDMALKNPLLMDYFIKKKWISVERALNLLQNPIKKEEIKQQLLNCTDSKKYPLLKEARIGCIALSEGTTAIGCFAFFKHEAPANFIVPDSVVSIGTAAFIYNHRLKSIVLGSGLKYIGVSAFYNCKNLKQIRFNGTIEQWNCVQKPGELWHYDVPTDKVVCLDGEAPL